MAAMVGQLLNRLAEVARGAASLMLGIHPINFQAKWNPFLPPFELSQYY
jgi:hypothetical protein